MLLFVIAFRERRGGLWLLFCFSGALTIYTHYYGGLVLLSLLVYALAYRKRYGVPLSWIIGGVCLIAALFSPWLISGVLEQALDAPKMLRGAVPPPWFAVHWDTPIVAINTFNNGRPWGAASAVLPAPNLSRGQRVVPRPAAVRTRRRHSQYERLPLGG